MRLNDRKILVLGATGMLGHMLLRTFSHRSDFVVHATTRSREGLSRWFAPELLGRIHTSINADKFDSVVGVLEDVHPDVVINCIGVIKQLDAAKDPGACIEINALFPHCLAKACDEIGARLIHISTDCVFSGKKGMYKEDDFPDCDDLYGRTKLLGEVDYPNAVTLRTSIVGHELSSNVSLVDWFLSQKGSVKGFVNAIYSGFPTVEMARIIAEVVIPRPDLAGLYHLSSEPISKYDLLKLVAQEYDKDIGINPFEDFHCDRSLDSTRFRDATGYEPPNWAELVKMMHVGYCEK